MRQLSAERGRRRRKQPSPRHKDAALNRKAELTRI